MRLFLILKNQITMLKSSIYQRRKIWPLYVPRIFSVTDKTVKARKEGLIQHETTKDNQ